MRRRRPGLAARLTAPVAWADPACNAIADWGERHPWVWFPIGPPDPRKPLGPREHTWLVVTSLLGTVAFEAVASARGTLATGREL